MSNEQEGLVSKKSLVAVIFFINIILELISVTNLVCGPTFQRLFHLSKSQLGLCLGISSLGTLLMSPLSGHVTHLWSAFPTLVTGLVLAILGVIFVTFATGFPLLLAGLILFGISASFIANANTTFLADLFREKLRRVMSLASGLWFASSALFAPVLGIWLKAVSQRNWGVWSFRGPYLFALLSISACLFLAYRVVRQVPKLQSRERKEKLVSNPAELPTGGREEKGVYDSAEPGAGNYPPNRKHWVWVLFFGLCHGLLYTTLLAWANPLVQNKFGVNDFYGALLYGMLALGIAGGRFILAGFKLVRDDRTVLAFSAIVGGTLFGLGLAAPWYGLTVVAMTIGGLGASATFPCIISLIGTKFSKNKAKIYGYNTASIALAGLIGSPIVGFLADHGFPLWWALGISPLAGFLLGFGSLLWKYQDRRVKSSTR